MNRHGKPFVVARSYAAGRRASPEGPSRTGLGPALLRAASPVPVKTGWAGPAGGQRWPSERLTIWPAAWRRVQNRSGPRRQHILGPDL